MVGERQPGANSRGRGGKFKKYTRGGGKHFSRDLQPVDAEGNKVSMWSEHARKDGEDSNEDDEDEEESDSEDDDGAPAGGQAALSREDRKKEKKARKEAAAARAKAGNVEVGDLPPSDSEEDSDEDGVLTNPNHSKAARNQTAPVVAPVDDAAEGVSKLSVGTPSRKERESAEAQQAKERYQKLHEQGKTDEAKADLARLKLIREKRDSEAARRQAEKEERDVQEAARKAEIDAKEAKKKEAALGPKAKGKPRK